jgi:thioredoxin 1
VNSDTFQAEVSSGGPVVVDFWAAWCGPCRAIAPILDELSLKYEGAVKVIKVDVSDNQELAKSFGVTSIPFIGVFENGKLVESQVGFAGRDKLERLFERLAS